MKNISLKKRVLAIASALAITTTALVAIPTAANAAPVCSTKSTVYADEYVTYQECVGVTSDGAQYVVQIPILFDGTLFLYSHGYRYPIDLPASIPVVGGYKVGKTPEPAPSSGSAAGVTRNALAMLAAGYATAGSGFTRKGWNADAAVATNVELIKLLRKEFPDIKRVVAWGESLGAFITQGISEKNPKLIKAAGLICPAAGSVEAELKMAGDALWGLKAFFDPTIKGGDYKSVLEVYSDIGKVLTVAGTLSELFKADPLMPKWPATSAAPATLKGAIPSRSAVVLVAAMSGVPTQSYSYDGVTGPGAPSSADAIRFASGLSPAFGALENLAEAAILGVLATYDIEQQVGGPIFDNSATNYADQLGDGLFEYGSALSGLDATQGMLAFLAAFPRAKANSAAVTKMRFLLSHKGKFNVPTIGVAAVADNVTPAGNLQWLIDKAAKKKSNNLLALWQLTPDSYTKFSATGVVSQRGVNGTGHCTSTTSQILAIAKMLDSAARSGKLPAGGTVKKATAAVGGLTYDPTYGAPLLKFYQK